MSPYSLPSRCYVAGLGASGLSTAKWLKKHNRLLGVWDDSQDKQAITKDENLPLLSPKQAFNAQVSPDALILSPGIPHTYPQPHPAVLLAKKYNCEIIGDIELFYRTYSHLNLIGITGTNGKSTTTSLMAHTLRYNNIKSLIGGNFGIPCFDLVYKPEFKDKNTWIVLELSSFNLELSQYIKPKIMILLNIEPDHLDRYSSFDNYAKAKTDILNRLDENTFTLIGNNISKDFIEYLPPNHIIFSEQDLPFSLKTSPHLVGDHNKENAAAVYLSATHLGLEEKNIQKAFENFQGLPHRQEIVKSNPDMDIINDSKATSFSAALRALSSYEDIHWIVGGLSKNDPIKQVNPYLHKIEHIYFFGKDGKNLEKDLNIYEKSTLFDTLQEATFSALKQAKKRNKKSTILLSPGCASFDQFRNFEHRGNSFKKFVQMFLENNKL